MSFQLDLNNVKIVDSLNDLSIYHYLDCDVNTAAETKQYRGVVMNNEGKTICRSFGYTPEIDETDDELMTSVVEPFLKQENVRALEAYEATLLRVYFYQDKWYISTCRKLDAFKSKWGSNKSFGEIFEDIVETSFEQFCENTLDKTKVYCYVIRTYNKNRIVCSGYEAPELFLVGTYDDGNFDQFNFEKCNVPRVNISTMDELKEHMKSIDPSKSQGVILMNEKGECVKVMKHEYVEAFKLRGNQPNILLRYIELQQEGDAKKVETFYNMYPEQKDLIVAFTEVIDDICYYVFRKYRNRFIRKQVSIVPADLYYVIRELHDGYLKDRNNIVTPERVSSYILGLECTRLLGLYNSYMKRKEENGNGFKISEEFMNKVKSMIV